MTTFTFTLPPTGEDFWSPVDADGWGPGSIVVDFGETERVVAEIVWPAPSLDKSATWCICTPTDDSEGARD